jgi:uncharacterized protein
MNRALIDISTGQLEIVKQIFRQRLTDDITVWVYGSRVTQKARQFSDLDIALEQHNGQLINTMLLAQLLDDFEESILPYKVDVMDYNTAKGIFKQNVDGQKVKLV